MLLLMSNENLLVLVAFFMFDIWNFLYMLAYFCFQFFVFTLF